jgi:hypothetical protein
MLHRGKILAFSLCLLVGTVHGIEQSYDDLDKQIVEAFNANPKRTADAFIACMEMIERSHRQGGRDAKAWRDKAEKIIPVACFYETTQAIQNNDYLNAYIWAKRGLAYGNKSGEIGGVNLKDINDFLVSAAMELKDSAAVKGVNYGKTMLAVADYRKVAGNSPAIPATQAGVNQPAKSIPDNYNKNLTYKVVDGPKNGEMNQLYVEIEFNSRKTKIYNYPGKGWKVDDWQPFAKEEYFSSWQAAAERFTNSGAAPQ